MKTKSFNWESKLVQTIELAIDVALAFLGMGTVLYFRGEIDVTTIESTFDFFRDLILTNLLQLFLIVTFFRVYKTSITKNSFRKVMPRIFLALLMTEITLVFYHSLSLDLHFQSLRFFIAFLYNLFI